ncbi:hypothetical protein Pcinc_012728 [Petrolisthes cinctipes]|uniref:Uncharacterized protein n=1 Tax=Petrolisthes cinctipes TaxID=88211 RepID=A0AAE1KTC4_PETCI|nr:hypothetical protein Pcinc_012728 [Petrolisthes cinctipes]
MPHSQPDTRITPLTLSLPQHGNLSLSISSCPTHNETNSLLTCHPASHLDNFPNLVPSSARPSFSFSYPTHHDHPFPPPPVLHTTTILLHFNSSMTFHPPIAVSLTLILSSPRPLPFLSSHFPLLLSHSHYNDPFSSRLLIFS